MTTEDDFQGRLDRVPHDWQTRLVFADWLAERNDLRADGYRALGQLSVWPHRAVPVLWQPLVGFTSPANPEAHQHFPNATLPEKWFMAIGGAGWNDFWVFFDNRRSAENTAALVLAGLGSRS